MNVFTRFVDIINSNINSLLDQAEDPEKMTKMYINKIEDTIVEIRTNCSSVLATKARVERSMTEIEAQVYRWNERAEKAAKKNLDELAIEALSEKKKSMVKLDEYKSQIEKYDTMIRGYREDIEKLEEKLAAAREKYEKIKAQADLDRETKKAEKGFDRYDRMEERIDRMTAERQARQATVDAERKFREMEEAEELQKELDELKSRLNTK